MSTRDLLVEIGTEELPPQALQKLSASFCESILQSLHDMGFSGLKYRPYATPRRLALLIESVPERQADQTIERRGPAVQAAFDKDGKPSKAAEGFAASCGVTVAQLSRLETDKGEWLYYQTKQAGRATADCVAEIVDKALSQLPIPKRMRWGSGNAEFVRPVHWIVLLYGEQVIEAEILGVKSGRLTFGHRFHYPQAIELQSARDYAGKLGDKAKVIADFASRRERIRELVLAKADELAGEVNLAQEDSLLDEVTALVEWPVALVCNFEQSYLQVPAEALVSTMKDNQKYFPVYDKQNRLTHHFIVISNLESRDPQQVRQGNERVVKPRLADAEFFWNQDRKKSLDEFNKKLGDVIFQRKLGTVYQKAERVAALASHIASLLGADQQHAARAGMLCKADLMTEMVFEFPKLQGIMGRYYALHAGESADVADAIEQHYWPRYAGDRLPESACAQCVALADKLDTLLGIFAAGDKPTGVRDPFALRRAALGVLKILIENKLDLDLQSLLQKAAEPFPAALKAAEVAEEVLDFMLGRLKAEYESMAQPFTPQQIAAVMACRPTRPLDFDRRVHAVRAFSELPQAESLSAANKRTANILKKAELKQRLSLDAKLLKESAEQELYRAINSLLPEVEPLCRQGQYQPALQKLAALRDPVDMFFDKVMVMTDDEKLKNNRLALLQILHAAFSQIADIALLQN